MIYKALDGRVCITCDLLFWMEIKLVHLKIQLIIEAYFSGILAFQFANWVKAVISVELN